MTCDWDDFSDDEPDEDQFGFTDADCGRWINGRLTDSCTLAGTEDCDFECPLRGISARSYYQGWR